MGEWGFVVGRFIRSAKPGEGESRPQRGDVLVDPARTIPILEDVAGPASAERTPEKLDVDAEGRLCTRQQDGTLNPGVWLTVGWHVIRTRFYGDTPPREFAVDVTAEHTEDAPLDLSTATEIDPATLEPVESAVPAWEAAVIEVRGLRDDTAASTATAKSKAEAAQLSAAHAENAQADAEQARTDAQTAAAAAHLDVDHDTTVGWIITRGTA